MAEIFGLHSGWPRVAWLLLVIVLLALWPTLPARAQALQDRQTQSDVQAQPSAQAVLQPQAGSAEVRATLSQSGQFFVHPRYGEVWIPSVTPQGWHPYPPCMWINTRTYGWYFNDTSDWGRIVHHYGRWAHDPQLGWIWVPGNEFSPGWVIWRSSKAYIGWAPMLPQQDVQTVSIAQFDSSDVWLFMDVAKFGKACTADVLVPLPQFQDVLQQTTYVSQIEYVDGIVIFVLPPWIVGEFVDIDLHFDPWSVYWFTQILIDWNWVWHHIVIHKTVKVCTPQYPTGR